MEDDGNQTTGCEDVVLDGVVEVFGLWRRPHPLAGSLAAVCDSP